MARRPLLAALCLATLGTACSTGPLDTEPRATARSALEQVQLNLATFKSADQTVEGGSVSRVFYSERSGDASLTSLAVDGGDLVVAGQLGSGRSAFGGVGVLVNAPAAPMDARGYRVLRLRLSAQAGVGVLRVRLVGTDAPTLQSGCYPVVEQPVTPQTRAYDIPLARFAPESYCGSRGVSAAKTLQQLDGIEIVDAVSPVRPRPVQFKVGALSLQS